MEQNELLLTKFLDSKGELPKSFNVYEKDLTEDGLAYFWGRIAERWYAAIDRGRPVENVRSLQLGLEKIRAVGAKEFLKGTRYHIYHSEIAEKKAEKAVEKKKGESK